MDASQPSVQVRYREPKKRRFRSLAEKRRIVEETLEAGASVARVALRHSVNSHQVFQWWKLYREGRLCEREVAGTKLLPVRVAQPASEAVRARGAQTHRAPSGVIHIEFPKGHLRVTGCVDAEALRVVLEHVLG